jgi:hypothetical protein
VAVRSRGLDLAQRLARTHCPGRHVARLDSSSAWAFELGLLEADLRERLSKRLGDRAPKQLRFAPGRLPEPAGPSPDDADRRAPDVTEQHRQAGRELAAPIADKNLRKLVAKAAAASLAKPSDDRSV